MFLQQHLLLSLSASLLSLLQHLITNSSPLLSLAWLLRLFAPAALPPSLVVSQVCV
uniref:Uncharacterized protein n=1 Tax=Arundo donax TaxID=35708 RepID=A0A0A9E694_ARUDO